MATAYQGSFRRWAAIFVALVAGSALPALADPLFTMEFVAPTGTAAVDEVIVIEARIELAPGSDTIVFGAEAVPLPFSAGGADFLLAAVVSMGDFFPDYDLNFGGPGSIDYTGPFAGLTLMAGEGLTLPFVTLTPPPGDAVAGLYQLSSAAVRVVEPDRNFVADFPASNSFERTVPEPSAALLGGGALATLLLLASARRPSHFS